LLLKSEITRLCHREHLLKQHNDQFNHFVVLLGALVPFLKTVRDMSHQRGYHSLISNKSLLILNQMREQFLFELGVTVISWNLA
jgi:hypothetical protein